MDTDFGALIRPEPPRLTEERDQLARKTRFEDTRPDIEITPGPGFWQAHRRLPDGSDTFTRYRLGELLDVLEQQYPPAGE